MHRLTSATLLRAFTLTLIVAAVGCNRKDAAYSEPGATATAVVPPTTSPIRVADIQVGKGVNTDKTVRNVTGEFGARDTVYASVRTAGSSAGSNLSAKWTYQNGQPVDETTLKIAPTGGDEVHEFHIVKATAWPKGGYKVEIVLDGVSAGTKEFSIK